MLLVGEYRDIVHHCQQMANQRSVSLYCYSNAQAAAHASGGGISRQSTPLSTDGQSEVFTVQPVLRDHSWEAVKMVS